MRLEITFIDSIPDGNGKNLEEKIKKTFGIKTACRFLEVYSFDNDHRILSKDDLENLANEVFADKIAQKYSTSGFFTQNWRIEIGFLPGVCDNVGKTAQEAVKDYLNKDISVYYSRIYSIQLLEPNQLVDETDFEKIAKLLYNPLIEIHRIFKPNEAASVHLPIVKIKTPITVEKINIKIKESEFAQLAKEKLLALSTDEFLAIKKYFSTKKIIDERKKHGLDDQITDVELEVIAQTWSEHCKHKIFNSLITYEEDSLAAQVGDNKKDHKKENEPATPKKETINSIFKTFIRGATEQIKKPYIVSVFKDNGGIIKFTHDFDIAVKVETHNAPSALDPYGGALTGVLGVQRDILGTGMGANPIANIDVLCFGNQTINPNEIPKTVLHPSVIMDGVVLGIEHGGNKMGIPTVNGSIIFEDCYNCRPLVYCGTIGLMPSKANNRSSSEKKIEKNYLAIMVGGRIGKDGIHGATFSSMQIDSSTPQSVVQIGDPITQKKMLDFILAARNKGLFEAITDNGAGGLSSSIGELAQFSNGCEIYLDKCPLKYPGLQPWEILLSESQERMTLAIKPEKFDELFELSKVHGTEITTVGKFTDSGKFHAFYYGQSVALLDLHFMHEGNPQLNLSARWKETSEEKFQLKKTKDTANQKEFDYQSALIELLKAPNITTKERVIRRFDHEVKGISVIKPIMEGPEDSAVIRPLYNSNEGIVISHGICPKFDNDPYNMAALAFDEAIRNAICNGAKLGYLSALDNFCWPDPIKSTKTPDGDQKLGALVRASKALYDCAIHFGVPFISGKDSMKNDYYYEGKKYSILPTVLITVVGKIEDIHKSVSSEFKVSGANLYLVGTTYDELGASEFAKIHGKPKTGEQPKARIKDYLTSYKAISHAIEESVIQSAHDLSDGGLAVAFAESALGLSIGAEIDLDLIKFEPNKETIGSAQETHSNINADAQKDQSYEDSIPILFAESGGRILVSVDPHKSAMFEKILEKYNAVFSKIGRVRGDKRLIVKKSDKILVNEEIEKIREAYEKGI